MCECDDKQNRNYYLYYDTPDGCDVDKKVMVATRYGLMSGLAIATWDVMLYSHAVGLSPILKRYAVHVLPLALMGATFAVVANGVQHARDRDDTWNYFAGGVACGPILGAYIGSPHAAFLGGLALGFSGMIKKLAVDQGVTLFPETKPHRNMINSWRHDYTVAKDPREKMIHTCGV